MTRETIESQKLMNKKINEEYEKVKADLEQYRKEKLDLIDASINQIILKVVQDVLGEAIPLSKHEELVIEALEKAKREDLFKISV